ncbi:MAG: hypothetical protein CMJ78_09350 [Planctomycetaceae bacterium]|nr:hypothetical protein [Planctomycetaceae bacterium]
MTYHITAIISVFFFLLCLVGFVEQLRELLRRKRKLRGLSEADRLAVPEHERPTGILSLNQFFASFLAFYSFLVYGLCSDPMEHYLVWTRLIATCLLLWILFEIHSDRRALLSLLAFLGGIVLMLVAAWLGFSGQRLTSARWVSAGLAIFATAVFVQGLTHQILWFRRTGHTGAVSLRMHQLTTAKDVSTLGFALAMGIADGWPLMVVAGSGIAVKSVLMWHFRWVRLSPQAATRRQRVAAAES